MMKNAPATTTTGDELAQVRTSHDLLVHVLEQRDRGSLAQFTGGLRLSFKSVKFLMKTPRLWPSVIIPAAINLILFIGIAGFAVWNSGALLDAVWAHPDPSGLWGWLAAGGWWVIRVLLVPLLLILSYFVTMAVGSVVASPFNDALSERVETVLLGESAGDEEGWRALVAGGLRGIVQSSGLFAIYAAVMVPILLLNLIPGVGSVAATVFGSVVSAFFLAVEYSDYAFERRKYGLREKVSTIWQYRSLSGGFGIGTSLLLWVPLLNFLCIPIAVVGGTALAVGVDQFGDGEADAELS